MTVDENEPAAAKSDAKPSGKAVLTDEQYDELARVFEADLDELLGLCFPHNKPVAEAKIRQMATILRRWLVDGDLQLLLNPLKASACFHVQDTSAVVAYTARSGAFRYLLTAQVKMDGRPVRFIYDSPLEFEEVDRSGMRDKHVGLNLKKFLAQPRMFHDGHWFSTGQIIRFVANKLGGNHLDFNRGGEWERLDRANDYFKYGGPLLDAVPGNAEIYLQFEPESREIIGGAHVEIIAAAASFLQMEIGGKPVRMLQERSSLGNELRKFFRRKPTVRMVERK